MQVNSVTAASGSATIHNSSALGKAGLGYNDFLQLLMAQMRHQDPTSPTDSTQWVAQLATFSNVEQAVQANAKLDRILQNSALSDAEGIIGRTISSADGSVSGIVASVSIASDGLTATLDSGAKLPISGNVTISR